VLTNDYKPAQQINCISGCNDFSYNVYDLGVCFNSTAFVYSHYKPTAAYSSSITSLAHYYIFSNSQNTSNKFADVNVTNIPALRFLVNDQRDAQFFTMYLFYFFILNSLHVSSTSCSSSGGTNCINTTSGNCRWPRPPTQSDSYQRLCWHNLSLLMMSTMSSKHVQS
jgi:hypothetical protein